MQIANVSTPKADGKSKVKISTLEGHNIQYPPQAKNFHKAMVLRGEINLSTRSGNLDKKKHSRKTNHKAKRTEY